MTMIINLKDGPRNIKDLRKGEVLFVIPSGYNRVVPVHFVYFSDNLDLTVRIIVEFDGEHMGFSPENVSYECHEPSYFDNLKSR